jgi:hypothetical protein
MTLGSPYNIEASATGCTAPKYVFFKYLYLNNYRSYLYKIILYIILICDKKSLLLVNEVLVKVSRRNMLMSSLINIRPFIKLLICNYSCLLSTIIFSFLKLIT